MEQVIDYYLGFEGEPEISLMYSSSDNTRFSIRIWEGYFDTMMSYIQPIANGEKGLFYYYDTHTGWYDHSPWKLLDLSVVINELQSIDKKILDQICLDILSDMYNLALQAKKEETYIWITYD